MDEINWDDLRLFLAVADAGGLGPAAAVTGKSAPTLGRRMLALERALGRELFVRKARGYDLTDDGQAFLAGARGIAARVGDLVHADAPPLVKISAGTWVTHVLVRAVDRIVGPTPVQVRFSAAEDLADIGRREAVIGVRNRRPDGVGLAGRRIGRVRFAVYGVDAGVTTWARVMASTPSAQWVKARTDGADAIEVTGSQSALDLALAGAARAVLPTFIGATQPGLVALSDPIEALDHEQWLVTHHEDRFRPEVRQVIDRVYAVLREVCAGAR